MAATFTPDEFSQAYDQYADAIFRHCFFRVRDRQRARDLTQETFLKTWDYLASGHAVDNLRPFLYTVASNLIIDGSRKRTESSLEALQDEGFEPGAPDPQHDPIEAKELRALLDTINPKYREVIMMRYLDDLSVKDIAASLEISENLASVRLHNGIKELRKVYPHDIF